MRSLSLADQAYQQIIGMIFNGRLQPGDALQEAKLAAEFGMSRTPVSEAIKRIEGEGLAEQQGRLVRVRLPSIDEIREVFFLRLHLEAPGARAAVSLPPQRVEQMAQRISALMAAGPANAKEEHWRVDDDFHTMLAEATGNQTVVRLIADMRRRTCMFDSEQVPHRFLRGCEEHLATLAAVQAGDADAAEAAMIRHIEAARDAILARLADIGCDRCVS